MASETARIPDRNKDRLSYTQSHYQVDLTQVTQNASINVSLSSICRGVYANKQQGVNKIEKEHELEIEVSTAAVRDQGNRAKNGEANEYMALVEGFINNVRVLARTVTDTCR